MTALQIAAILQLLLSFGVSQSTVNNVNAILTNAATPATVVMTAPVGNTGPLPTATQTAPVATPIQTPPTATVTPASTPVATPTPAPASALTITPGTLGTFFITAGKDPVILNSIAITVPRGTPVLSVSTGGHLMENSFGATSLDAKNVWPTDQWYLPMPEGEIPADGTLEIDVNAPTATSMSIEAYTATDRLTGNDISKHAVINGFNF